PTTHADPTYLVGNALIYAVANMPGAFPVTSTYALTNATLPFVADIAQKGWLRAMRENPVLARGLSSYQGQLTSAPVGDAWGYPSVPITSALGG
ncbi:MAG: alanine dehydrogenase, partial [Micrococcales bacterium]|nr:alanine dehydrogenase [Micrococcales bacterium]